MSVSSFIARRYLGATRENRFFSWIALLSVVGIAIGVAAMIVVLSVINGFESELRKRFLAANAHILAFNYPGGLERPESWAEKFEKEFPDDIMATSPFVHNETMARKDSLMHSILVRGISPTSRDKVQSLRAIVEPMTSLDLLQAEIDSFAAGAGQPAVPSVILGKGLLSLLDAKIGDTVRLVAPESESLSELIPFKVVGVYDSGLKHYDNKLGIVSLTTAQQFFKMKQRVTGIEIGLYKPRTSLDVAARMSEKYTIQIKDWQSFNRQLFEAMNMERAVIAIIVFLVSGVAGFNILTTLFISVTQKQKSISILKALGATNRQIQRLFVLQGLYVGIIGCLVGNVLALVISAVLERYQFVDLPDLYLLATLPISYDWRVYAWVTGAGMVIAILAGIYPALVASRVVPTEGLKGTRGFA